MTTFVDTSALFALLDEDDANHARAARWIRGPGADPSETLITHNYVAVESIALVRGRRGAPASRALIEAWLPALTMAFVDEVMQRSALHAFLSSVSRKPSFVDHVSFHVMRELDVQRAFAFDRDFVRQGFETVP